MSQNANFGFAAFLLVTLLAGQSSAATATGSLNVKMTITAECKIATGSTSLLDFGTTGVLDKNIDRTATISVLCTAQTDYKIGLNAGTTAGGTAAIRKMSGTPATATIDYLLFQDTGHTKNWGNTDGTDVVTGIGTGNVQNLVVHGRVPPQATPVKGDYTDTVAITISY